MSPSNKTELSQKQLLLTTQNGTFTGSIFNLKLVKKDNENNEDANETSVRSTGSEKSEEPKPITSDVSNNNDKETDEELRLMLEDGEDKQKEKEKEKEKDQQQQVVVAKSNNDNGKNNDDDRQPSNEENQKKANDENAEDHDDSTTHKKAKKHMLRVFPPLAILIPDLFDLPEPSFRPLAENLLRFGICHTILVPHLRGFEPSSIQKDLIYSGYSLAEIAVDVIKWLDEVVVNRKYVSSMGGVILVGHGFYGSLICEVVNAVFWGRRELTIRSQPGNGFWRSSSHNQNSKTDSRSKFDSTKEPSAYSAMNEETEEEKQAKAELAHSRTFLIRGMVFLNSAPPANLIHEVSSFRKILFNTATVPSLKERLAIFVFVFSFSLWLWMALIFPPVFVENRVPQLISAWWKSYSDSGTGNDEIKKKKAASVIRHLQLGGTERWIRFPDKVKKPENINDTDKISSITKDEECDNKYISSVLRSRSTPVGSCQKSIAGHIVSFASLFNRFGAQHDVWTMLNNLAEKRKETVKNIVQEIKERNNKTMEESSLMMLYQLSRLRTEDTPAWEEVAPLVPVLCIVSQDLSNNPLGVPESLQKSILERTLKCDLSTSNNEDRDTTSSSTDQEQQQNKKKISASSPCSNISVVTISETNSYWMHEMTSTAPKEEEKQDRGKYLMSSPSFLCALSIAKFIRRGMLYESALEEKNAEQQEKMKKQQENSTSSASDQKQEEGEKKNTASDGPERQLQELSKSMNEAKRMLENQTKSTTNTNTKKKKSSRK